MINLYLDDIRWAVEDYPYKESKDTLWLTVRDIETCQHWLTIKKVNNISLDGDMGQDSTGKDIPGGVELLEWMMVNNIWPEGFIFIHSRNPIKKEVMRSIIQARKK